ncbi:hypothetical protein MEG05_15860 [Vibrio aestuarianus]|uniref:hypothetical protein n=2 Tax=Vibrio TaxID=662 RepID=UPI00237CF213|nr:hypothetical protein [Vibrio aestuarianus]MDE1315534.1 hypothetical protein [Vibrio aestuarianus]
MDKAMSTSNYRFSKVQREILIRLTHAFMRDIKEAKSTVLNQAVNKMLDASIHPNNFRASCKILEERGFIMRKKVEFDWYINITPKGFELALDWIDSE